LVFVVPAGTVTVAVFTRLPVAVDTTGARTVIVATPPTARLNVASTFPDPLPVPDDPDPVYDADHVAPTIVAGSTSTTRPPVSRLGPEFVTVTVYVSV
jgi:hypothetical protein